MNINEVKKKTEIVGIRNVPTFPLIPFLDYSSHIQIKQIAVISWVDKLLDIPSHVHL